MPPASVTDDGSAGRLTCDTKTPVLAGSDTFTTCRTLPMPGSDPTPTPRPEPVATTARPAMLLASGPLNRARPSGLETLAVAKPKPLPAPTYATPPPTNSLPDV